MRPLPQRACGTTGSGCILHRADQPCQSADCSFWLPILPLFIRRTEPALNMNGLDEILNGLRLIFPRVGAHENSQLVLESGLSDVTVPLLEGIKCLVLGPESIHPNHTGKRISKNNGITISFDRNFVNHHQIPVDLFKWSGSAKFPCRWQIAALTFPNHAVWAISPSGNTLGDILHAGSISHRVEY